jgi:sterol desaturase/sphingolipid hydroxylase (fatty acid hydroxylase superfamily)
MDLIALAIPFFLLALLVEMAVDRFRGTGYYRANDAINSLSAGTLSTTFGYFTRLLPAAVWAYALQNFALIDLDPAWFDLSPRGLLLWGAALIAFDFSYYWKHRMGHEVSILWAAHAVHHQSEEYNLSTALRQTSTDFLFGWVFYLPLFLLGMPFEVFVTVNALDLIYQFWVHTRFVGKLGWLEYVLVTPSNHRVHHAQNERYIDRNYGGILIIWDRLFGTFQEERDDDPVVFGVRKPLASWNPFWANLQVYDYLWYDAMRTARWRDKVGIWFRRTGWRPADATTPQPETAPGPAGFRKYDPPLSPGVRRYIVWQFVAAAAGVLWIGNAYATEGARAVLIPCLLLWVTLYSIGGISEGRPGARRLEWLRLLIVMPAGLWAMLETATNAQAVARSLWSALALYAAISGIGFTLATSATEWKARKTIN